MPETAPFTDFLVSAKIFPVNHEYPFKYVFECKVQTFVLILQILVMWIRSGYGHSILFDPHRKGHMYQDRLRFTFIIKDEIKKEKEIDSFKTRIISFFFCFYSFHHHHHNRLIFCAFFIIYTLFNINWPLTKYTCNRSNIIIVIIVNVV